MNVIEISKFLNISTNQFLQKYTNRLLDENPEIVLKAIEQKNRCILNDKNTNMCTIHSVKPMQCVTFPLVPIDLENDIFFNQDTCVCKNKKEIKVIDWLNGKKGIYVKYKKMYIRWISLVEKIQKKWSYLSKQEQQKIYELLFCDYNNKITNIKHAVKKRFKAV